MTNHDKKRIMKLLTLPAEDMPMSLIAMRMNVDPTVISIINSEEKIRKLSTRKK